MMTNTVDTPEITGSQEIAVPTETHRPIPCRTDPLCKGNPPGKHPEMKNPPEVRYPAQGPTPCTPAEPAEASETNATPASRSRSGRCKPRGHPHSGELFACRAAPPHCAPPRAAEGPARQTQRPIPRGHEGPRSQFCAVVTGAALFGSVAQANIGLRLRADVFPKPNERRVGCWSWARFPVPVGVCRLLCYVAPGEQTRSR